MGTTAAMMRGEVFAIGGGASLFTLGPSVEPLQPNCTIAATNRSDEVADFLLIIFQIAVSLEMGKNRGPPEPGRASDVFDTCGHAAQSDLRKAKRSAF